MSSFCLKIMKNRDYKRKKCTKIIKNTTIMLSNTYKKRYNRDRLTVQ